MRRQMEWKVPRYISFRLNLMPSSLSRLEMRVVSSRAALSVKVTTNSDSGATPFVRDEVDDALDQRERLARARAGDDQHRAVGGQDGFELLRVGLAFEGRQGMHLS